MPRVPSSPPMLSILRLSHPTGVDPPAHPPGNLLPTRLCLESAPQGTQPQAPATSETDTLICFESSREPLSFPPRTALTPSLSPLHPSQVCSRTSFWERSYYPPETTIINFRTLVLFCMKTLSGSPLRPQFMATSLAFGKHSLDN